MGRTIPAVSVAVMAFLVSDYALPFGAAGEERFPGAQEWGEVRVSAVRMPAGEFTVSPDGKQIAFFGYNPVVHLYELASGTVRLTVPCTTAPHDVAYSPDGRSLVTAEWVDGVRVRDARTGKVLSTLKPEADLGASSVAFAGDGKVAAYCWRSKAGAGSLRTEQLALWHVATEQLIGWPTTKRVEKDGQMIRRGLIGVGRLLISTETRTEKGRVVARSVTLTDPTTNKVSAKVILDASDDFVFDVDPKGATLLVYNRDEPPRLVDVGTGKSTVRFKGHTQYVSCGAFSPDGKLIATASSTLRRTMLAPKIEPAAGDPTEIILWEAATGKKVATLRDTTTLHDFHKVVFSPDSKLVIAMTTPERPVPKKERKGGVLLLWGKAPK